MTIIRACEEPGGPVLRGAGRPVGNDVPALSRDGARRGCRQKSHARRGHKLCVLIRKRALDGDDYLSEQSSTRIVEFAAGEKMVATILTVAMDVRNTGAFAFYSRPLDFDS